jgi:hypothetical protein
MARRILYNPADFVEASTPFYDNLVGAITDFADRLERNQHLKREMELMHGERLFEVAMGERRFEMQESLQEDQFAFRREEGRLQREQMQAQHQDRIDLGWAQLRDQRLRELRQQIEAAHRERTQERGQRQGRIDGMFNQLRKSQLVPGGSPPMLHVGYIEEQDRWVVGNLENGDEWDYDQWITHNTPLFNLSEMMLGGQNFKTWADSNLYDAPGLFSGVESFDVRRPDGTMTTVQPRETADGEVDRSMLEDIWVDGEGNPYYGRDAFVRLVENVRQRNPGWEASLHTINEILDSDSNVNLLRRDDERAEFFDQRNVSDTVGSLRVLEDANIYTGRLIEMDGTAFATDDYKEYLPNLVPTIFTNMPNKDIPAKTVGEANHALIKYQNRFGYSSSNPDGFRSSDPQFDQMRNAVNSFQDFSLNIIKEYFDDIVPQAFRDKSPEFLANIVMINPEEYRKRDPNVRQMLLFPTDPEEIGMYQEMDSYQVPNLSVAEQRRRQQSMIDAYHDIEFLPRDHWDRPRQERERTGVRAVPREFN